MGVIEIQFTKNCNGLFIIFKKIKIDQFAGNKETITGVAKGLVGKF